MILTLLAQCEELCLSSNNKMFSRCSVLIFIYNFLKKIKTSNFTKPMVSSKIYWHALLQKQRRWKHKTSFVLTFWYTETELLPHFAFVKICIFTLSIGIFVLTESISEKSISATTIPVETRSTNSNKYQKNSKKHIKIHNRWNQDSHQVIFQPQIPTDQWSVCRHNFLFSHYAFLLEQQLWPEPNTEQWNQMD